MLGARRARLARTISLVACIAVVLLPACGKKDTAPPPKPTPSVTVISVTPRDVPAVFEYVAQTQSSQQVNIQARVSGFLDKRVYTEGSLVKAGQTLFLMDQKPYQAQVDAAKAQVSKSQAALNASKSNLDRVKPLAAQDALSQKDLDDATANYESASATLDGAKAQLETAQLNLSYCTITSPVAGISGSAQQADGTYINAQNSQLTTVAVLSPMWVNFSLSENEVQSFRNQVEKGQLQRPPNGNYVVEIVMLDGSLFPRTGSVTFTDPSFNAQTGTFLIRASVDNPEGLLRPNQYVRVRVKGAMRPNAILVPQQAVLQGSKGHVVWVVDKDSKAESRPVTVGDWVGNDWVITEGLQAGDRVIVDGGFKLAPGTVVNARAKPLAVAAQPAIEAPRLEEPTRARELPAQIFFGTGEARLNAGAEMVVSEVVSSVGTKPPKIDLTGFADRAGDSAVNRQLADARAAAVRDALVAAGYPTQLIRLAPAREVSGDEIAHRVEVSRSVSAQ